MEALPPQCVAFEANVAGGLLLHPWPQSFTYVLYCQPVGQTHPKTLPTYRALGNMVEHEGIWGAVMFPLRLRDNS